MPDQVAEARRKVREWLEDYEAYLDKVPILRLRLGDKAEEDDFTLGDIRLLAQEPEAPAVPGLTKERREEIETLLQRPIPPEMAEAAGMFGIFRAHIRHMLAVIDSLTARLYAAEQAASPVSTEPNQDWG